MSQQQPIIEEITEYLLSVSETIPHGLCLLRVNKIFYTFCKPVMRAVKRCAKNQPPTASNESYLGGITWLNKWGQKHRDWDLPAQIIRMNGGDTKIWYKKGEMHRADNLPAILFSNGVRQYYYNGVIMKPPSVIFLS